MIYKIGDKVRIATKKLIPEYWNEEGKMDKWMGKVMTIKEIFLSTPAYRMLEDEGENFGRGWLWYDNMIEGLADDDKGNYTFLQGKRFI